MREETFITGPRGNNHTLFAVNPEKMDKELIKVYVEAAKSVKSLLKERSLIWEKLDELDSKVDKKEISQEKWNGKSESYYSRISEIDESLSSIRKARKHWHFWKTRSFLYLYETLKYVQKDLYDPTTHVEYAATEKLSKYSIGRAIDLVASLLGERITRQSIETCPFNVDRQDNISAMYFFALLDRSSISIKNRQHIDKCFKIVTSRDMLLKAYRDLQALMRIKKASMNKHEMLIRKYSNRIEGPLSLLLGKAPSNKETTERMVKFFIEDKLTDCGIRQKIIERIKKLKVDDRSEISTLIKVVQAITDNRILKSLSVDVKDLYSMNQKVRTSPMLIYSFSKENGMFSEKDIDLEITFKGYFEREKGKDDALISIENLKIGRSTVFVEKPELVSRTLKEFIKYSIEAFFTDEMEDMEDDLEHRSFKKVDYGEGLTLGSKEFMSRRRKGFIIHQ